MTLVDKRDKKLQIRAIQSPTFGYDKKLDKKLEETLKQNPDGVSNSINGLRQLCNTMEDEIVLSEKKHAPMSAISSLADIFMPLKLHLINMVDNNFPHLNYSSIEFDHYVDTHNEMGFKKDQDSWREEISERLLEGDVDELIEEQEERIAELTEKNISLQEEILDAEFHKGCTPKPQNLMPPVISQFKPTSDSPVGFVSLGGMDALKEELRDKIITPILEPEAAELDSKEYGKKYPRGILLYGPPGCGKTFITEALAAEADIPLFKLKVSQAGSIYINETSRNYETAFQKVADKAKEIGKPCLLFIDEVDAITKARDVSDNTEDVKQMQTLLDLIETARGRGIVVIGATNMYGLMDDAIKRRFNEQIYVGMPDFETRKSILIKNLEKCLKGKQLLQNKDKINEIAKSLDGFSNDAICVISDKAALNARAQNRANIDVPHYTKAISASQNLKVKEDKYAPKPEHKIGFSS